jgi:hypothetical protein
MFIIPWFPEALCCAWAIGCISLEQIAWMQYAQAQLAKAFLEEIRHGNLQYRMRQLELRVIANPQPPYFRSRSASRAEIHIVAETKR